MNTYFLSLRRGGSKTRNSCPLRREPGSESSSRAGPVLGNDEGDVAVVMCDSRAGEVGNRRRRKRRANSTLSGTGSRREGGRPLALNRHIHPTDPHGDPSRREPVVKTRPLQL